MQKNGWIRWLAMAAALVLLWADFPFFPTEAQAEVRNATYGNAVTTTVFYVTTSGPATLTLSQSGQGQAQKQYLYNNKTLSTEYTYAQYSVLSKGSMDAMWTTSVNWTEKTCTINFYRADVYTVYITPTPIQNIATSTVNWQFTQWLTMPAWYVSGVKNCAISSNNPLVSTTQPPAKTPTKAPKPTKTPKPTATPLYSAVCTVIYQASDQDLPLYVDNVTITGIGKHKIQPMSFNGYELAYGTPKSYTVQMKSNGQLSDYSVIFYLQPIATPTPIPSAKLTVIYRTDDGEEVYREKVTLKGVGKKTVKPKEISGYQLTYGSPTFYTVQLKSNGKLDPATIYFYVEPIVTPTPVVTGKVTVIYQTEGGKELDREKVTLKGVGMHNLKARSISGYKLVGNSSYVVTLSSKGKVSTDVVVFVYRKLPTPTPAPTRQPKANEVKVSKWGTHFSENPSQYNEKVPSRLKRLADDDPSTTFYWLVYTRDNSKPVITASFKNATIGSIAIRNGNAASSGQFNNYGRGIQYGAIVYTADGKEYSFTLKLPNSYSKNYHMFTLHDKYDNPIENVTSVELYLEQMKMGADNPNRNVVHIADILFFKK